MTTGQRRPAAKPGGGQAKKSPMAAHKFIVIRCFRSMKGRWDEHSPSSLPQPWNRGHTACVHIWAVIDERTPTVMSAKDANRTNGVFSATPTRRLRGHRLGLWQGGENNEHPWGGKPISETTCDAASLARRLYKTQIVPPYPSQCAVWRVRCNRMR